MTSAPVPEGLRNRTSTAGIFRALAVEDLENRKPIGQVDPEPTLPQTPNLETEFGHVEMLRQEPWGFVIR